MLFLFAFTRLDALCTCSLQHYSEGVGGVIMQTKPAHTVFLWPATKCNPAIAPVRRRFPFLPAQPSPCHVASVKSRVPFPCRGMRLRLGGNLGLAVGDLDTELLGTRNDFYPLAR